MKKNTTRKNTSVKKRVGRPPKTVATDVRNDKQTKVNGGSLSIYFYWFIILFFIAATFYILGRSHGTITTVAPTANNVEITEEALLQPADYYNSGRDKLIAGDVNGAIADLTAAIESDAGTDAYILRGEAYMQISDYRSALNDFNSAIERDPVNAVAYYDRALLNTRIEDYASALNDINNALAAETANPTNILQMRDLYAKRGQLNLWLKNWQGAIADYTNSLARPDGVVSPSVYAERAEAYTAIGNYADAINDYASAIRVISEQIQGATTTQGRESLSSNAMAYFEKSAALNLALGNTAAARNDLESAYTIAAALADTASMNRIQGAVSGLQQ